MDTNPDVWRGLMVSMGMVLFGLVLGTAWTSYRQRDLPAPARVSPGILSLLVLGYLLFIVHTVIERWERIGDPISVDTYFAFLTLAVNLIAVWLLRRERPEDKEGANMAAVLRRDSDEAARAFRLAMRRLDRLELYEWRKKHPGEPFPYQRRHDRLKSMSLGEITTVLQEAGADEVRDVS